MNIRNKIKAFLPSRLWHLAGFCKRLPIHWRMDRSDSLRVLHKLDGLPLFVTPDVYVQIPESLTAVIHWRSQAFEDTSSSLETRDFLKLSEGRSGLIDVGAQTGSMSAFFARSRSSPAQILSLEPDPEVHAILDRARELNSPPGITWEIRHEAVSNIQGTISIPVTNTSYEADHEKTNSRKLIEAPCQTLASLFTTINWVPDILKIDVESFEFEILTSSLPLIEELRPALQIEVHWEYLKSRNLDAMAFLEPLAALGYRGIRRNSKSLRDWQRESFKKPLSRLSLHIP